MKRLDIDAATLRELVEQYPLYQIAQRYDCEARRVVALARDYGFGSAFTARPATADEVTEIFRLVDAGWSAKRIATYLGRSQDFVGRRVNNLVLPPDRHIGRPTRIGWPKVESTPEKALCGRHYEDVDEETLLRECPPGRWPINGAALAAAGRWSATSQSRSAADLCAEA